MRRRVLLRTAALAALLGLVVSVTVVARGGQSSKDKTRATPAPRAAVPAPVVSAVSNPVVGNAPALSCPKLGRSRPRPKDFPADIPLPARLVLKEVRRYENTPGQLVVSVIGLAPLSLQSAVRFFLREFQRRGYAMRRSDAEPGEAEATYIKGSSTVGFKVGTRSGCERVVGILVLVIKGRGAT